MSIQEKEILEALSSSRILTSMITPAVLISACGTLIFSTSARLGRIFDRVTVMKSEVEAIATNVQGAVISNSGHWIMEEQPQQAIAVITGFLKKEQ